MGHSLRAVGLFYAGPGPFKQAGLAWCAGPTTNADQGASTPLTIIGEGMKLVFLHGPPAAGKLTTAKALLTQVNGRLFDNHAAIDVARTVLDFGVPGFFELVQEVRKSVLTAAADQGVALVVMTFVYADPEDLSTYEAFEKIVHQRGGQILPVFLNCSAGEIVRRVGNAERVARKKMT
jgi:hypothetical protein